MKPTGLNKLEAIVVKVGLNKFIQYEITVSAEENGEPYSNKDKDSRELWLSDATGAPLKGPLSVKEVNEDGTEKTFTYTFNGTEQTGEIAINFKGNLLGVKDLPARYEPKAEYDYTDIGYKWVNTKDFPQKILMETELRATVFVEGVEGDRFLVALPSVQFWHFELLRNFDEDFYVGTIYRANTEDGASFGIYSEGANETKEKFLLGGGVTIDDTPKYQDIAVEIDMSVGDIPPLEEDLSTKAFFSPRWFNFKTLSVGIIDTGDVSKLPVPIQGELGFEKATLNDSTVIDVTVIEPGTLKVDSTKPAGNKIVVTVSGFDGEETSDIIIYYDNGIGFTPKAKLLGKDSSEYRTEISLSEQKKYIDDTGEEVGYFMMACDLMIGAEKVPDDQWWLSNPLYQNDYIESEVVDGKRYFFNKSNIGDRQYYITTKDGAYPNKTVSFPASTHQGPETVPHLDELSSFVVERNSANAETGVVTYKLKLDLSSYGTWDKLAFDRKGFPVDAREVTVKSHDGNDLPGLLIPVKDSALPKGVFEFLYVSDKPDDVVATPEIYGKLVSDKLQRRIKGLSKYANTIRVEDTNTDPSQLAKFTVNVLVHERDFDTGKLTLYSEGGVDLCDIHGKDLPGEVRKSMDGTEVIDDDGSYEMYYSPSLPGEVEIFAKIGDEVLPVSLVVNSGSMTDIVTKITNRVVSGNGSVTALLSIHLSDLDDTGTETLIRPDTVVLKVYDDVNEEILDASIEDNGYVNIDKQFLVGGNLFGLRQYSILVNGEYQKNIYIDHGIERACVSQPLLIDKSLSKVTIGGSSDPGIVYKGHQVKASIFTLDSSGKSTQLDPGKHKLELVPILYSVNYDRIFGYKVDSQTKVASWEVDKTFDIDVTYAVMINGCVYPDLTVVSRGKGSPTGTTPRHYNTVSNMFISETEINEDSTIDYKLRVELKGVSSETGETLPVTDKTVYLNELLGENLPGEVTFRGEMSAEKGSYLFDYSPTGNGYVKASFRVGEYLWGQAIDVKLSDRPELLPEDRYKVTYNTENIGKLTNNLNIIKITATVESFNEDLWKLEPYKGDNFQLVDSEGVVLPGKLILQSSKGGIFTFRYEPSFGGELVVYSKVDEVKIPNELTLDLGIFIEPEPEPEPELPVPDAQHSSAVTSVKEIDLMVSDKFNLRVILKDKDGNAVEVDNSLITFTNPDGTVLHASIIFIGMGGQGEYRYSVSPFEVGELTISVNLNTYSIKLPVETVRVVRDGSITPPVIDPKVPDPDLSFLRPDRNQVDLLSETSFRLTLNLLNGFGKEITGLSKQLTLTKPNGTPLDVKYEYLGETKSGVYEWDVKPEKVSTIEAVVKLAGVDYVSNSVKVTVTNSSVIPPSRDNSKISVSTRLLDLYYSKSLNVGVSLKDKDSEFVIIEPSLINLTSLDGTALQAGIKPLGMISPGLYSFSVEPYVIGEYFIRATVSGFDIRLDSESVTVIDSSDGEVVPGEDDKNPNQGLSSLRPDRNQLDLKYGNEFGLTLHLLNGAGVELGGLSSQVELVDLLGRELKADVIALGETSTGVYSWIISPKGEGDLDIVARISSFGFETNPTKVSVIDSTVVDPEVPVDPDPKPKPKYYTSILSSEIIAKQANGLNEIRIIADVTVNTEGENDYEDYIGKNISIVDNLGNPLPGELELVSSLVGRYEFMYYPNISGHLFVRTLVEDFITDGTITLSLGEFNTEGGEDPGQPESKYPLDEYGNNPENFIKGEVHTVSSLAFRDYFLLVPEASPFYAKDLLIQYRAPNSTDLVTLTLDVDYTLALEYVGASRALRRPVYGGIVFQNLNLSGIITVSYRTVGGDHIADSQLVIGKLIEQVWNPKIVYWEYVTNVPNIYPPEPHPHEFEDFSGAKEIVEAINKVSSEIAIDGEMNRETISDFLAKFNVNLFSKLMKGFLDHPYHKLMSDMAELKLQFDNIEKLGLTSGGTFGLQFGVIYPTMNPKPNKGCFFLNGDKFDLKQYPKLAELFPDGVLPDARGRYLIGAGGDYSLMDFVAQKVLKHNHTSTMDTAGMHNHATTVSENGAHNHETTIESSGSHSHSVSLSSDGEHTHVVTAAANGAHNHTVTVAEAGAHNHAITVSNGGAHGHTGTASSGGGHTHTRGSMNITGNLRAGSQWDANVQFVDALQADGAFRRIEGGKNWTDDPGKRNQGQPWGTSFDASRNWTGETSNAGSHTHTVSVSNGGAHNHAATATAVGNHVHGTTVSQVANHTHQMSVSTVSSHTHTASVTTNGAHVHKAVLVAAPNHKHAVTVHDNGEHTHKLTIHNTGEDKQLVDAIAVNYMILAA